MGLIFTHKFPLNMAHGTRIVYPNKRNKGLSSTFQPPEEGQSIQQLKCCDKHGDKDEHNSPNHVNNNPQILILQSVEALKL